MILGIGVDIASIKEFERIVGDGVGSFIEKHFSKDEIAYANAHHSGRPQDHLAVRYAAKEATIKALDQARSTRVPRLGNIDYCDMEVVIDTDGRPSMELKGALTKISREIGVKNIHTSLSHDAGSAVAFVILEG